MILSAVWRMIARFKGEWALWVRRRSSLKVTSERPVEAAVHGPMGVHDGGEDFEIGGERRDVESGLEAFAAGLFVDAPSDDRCERAQAFPSGATLGEPAGVGDAALPLLDPAMAGLKERSATQDKTANAYIIELSI